METNFTPGQILYIKSSVGPWYYISVLHYATPVKHMDETHELHTCCDLCVDEDGSECRTFARSNGSFLDLDTTFSEIREATEVERECLYKALVRSFKEHDLSWSNHFTDSTYFDILDWLAWAFGVDLEDKDIQNAPIRDTMWEIQNYIWDALCKETGNYQACTDYVEPEMVNKDKFIAKVRNWLEKHTYDDKYWTSEGDDLYLGNLIGDICKHLEE
jgi:hypothetical protein